MTPTVARWTACNTRPQASYLNDALRAAMFPPEPPDDVLRDVVSWFPPVIFRKVPVLSDLVDNVAVVVEAGEDDVLKHLFLMHYFLRKIHSSQRTKPFW